MDILDTTWLGGLIYSLLEQMLKRKRCFKLGVAKLGNPSI